jgi:hypothetical protein
MNTTDKEPPTYRGVPLDNERSLEATIDDAFDAGFEAGATFHERSQRAMYGDYGRATTDPDPAGAAVIVSVLLCLSVITYVAIKALS